MNASDWEIEWDEDGEPVRMWWKPVALPTEGDDEVGATGSERMSAKGDGGASYSVPALPTEGDDPADKPH